MATRKRQLSQPRQRLLEQLQEISFGQIRNVHVRGGEPLFHPAPVVVKDWKLDGENGARPEIHLPDFALMDQHLRLFEVFDTICDGTIDEIHIRAGLPCRVLTSRLIA